MPRTRIIGIIISCLGISGLMAQTAAEIDAMRQVMPVPQPPQAHWKPLAEGNHNEAQWLASQMFVLYKALISSQDGQKCSFHPSCSEYAMLAVKKYGIVQGMLAAFDRLTRCNGLNQEWYEIDNQRHVLIDQP